MDEIPELTMLPKVLFQHRETLPSICAVYCALSNEGEVFYIGRSINLNRRFANHHYIRHLTALKCLWIAWIACQESAAPLIEKTLIQHFQPPLNGPSGCQSHPFPSSVLPPSPSLLESEEEYRTTSEAAQALGVSIRRVQALLQTGRLPAIKYGRDWFIPAAALRTFQPRKAGRPPRQSRGAEAAGP